MAFRAKGLNITCIILLSASSAVAPHQYYQLPTNVMHQPSYNTSQQPYPLHTGYLQQQPHPLAAHFNTNPAAPNPSHQHQVVSQPVNHITSPVTVQSPSHLLQQGHLHLQQGQFLQQQGQPHNTLMTRVTTGLGP